MKDAGRDLLSEVVRGPAEDLPVLRPLSGLVVAKAHDALGRRDLEPRLGAVEEPAERGGLGLGVNLGRARFTNFS
jgi:hypothetical protein